LKYYNLYFRLWWIIIIKVLISREQADSKCNHKTRTYNKWNNLLWINQWIKWVLKIFKGLVIINRTFKAINKTEVFRIKCKINISLINEMINRKIFSHNKSNNHFRSTEIHPYNLNSNYQHKKVTTSNNNPRKKRREK
jgi:hypothetical protein